MKPVPKGPFSATDAARLARNRFGRDVSQRRLASVSKRLFGRTDNLSAREIVGITRQINLKRAELTPALHGQLRSVLLYNQFYPAGKKMSFGQIIRAYSPRRGPPISESMLKKINADIRRQVVAQGGVPKKYVANVLRGKENILPSLKTLLIGDINLKIRDAARLLSLSPKQLQYYLAQNETNFGAELKKAKINAVRDLDMQTKGALFSHEIAARLNLKAGYVAANRIKRGRAESMKAVQGRMRFQSLSWLSALTTPEGGMLEPRYLCTLTGANDIRMKGILAALMGEKFVVQKQWGFRPAYGITARGVAYLNRVGEEPAYRPLKTLEMSTVELKTILERLKKARYGEGAPIHSEVIKLIEGMMRLKQEEEQGKAK